MAEFWGAYYSNVNNVKLSIIKHLIVQLLKIEKVIKNDLWTNNTQRMIPHSYNNAFLVSYQCRSITLDYRKKSKGTIGVVTLATKPIFKRTLVIVKRSHTFYK